ncbi:hypothetical protein ACG92Y_03075 [Acinetobacter ursingii]|uniref:hypothetical protein n=1 Tax=Acinetobacter ursingii TaxID=108980 RepID=UPI00300A7334
MTDLILWQQEIREILPADAITPAQISSYAVQLSQKDKKQIVAAFEAEHFEMGINYLWGKTLTALKKVLSTVGVSLLGEMLNRPDLNDDDDIDDILTPRESIRLAEELGVISKTEALRLQHTHELITHFSQLELEEADSESIDINEALVSLKACVRSVLGKPKVEVAKKFVEFRAALEDKTINSNDESVEMLKSSPYFFLKLTISVLMNAAKRNVGANLEHSLANINILIPSIWPQLRDSEKWQIGYTYAETYAEGKTSSVAGLKSTLSKVQGFDFVPENLRSDTFIKAASAILKAHDGLNNFYNELPPVKDLSKLGSTIPSPALPACITALLSVVLGNSYGVAWDAEVEASKILNKITEERWQYYLNNVLPSDTRILNKLLLSKPLENWLMVVGKYNLANATLRNSSIDKLIKASRSKNENKVRLAARKLLEEYYGKQ